jgi:predicted small secreted protein
LTQLSGHFHFLPEVSSSHREEQPMQSEIRQRAVMAILLCVALAAWAFTTPGCNTVKGAGEDVQSAGEAGQEAINKEEEKY